MWPVTAILQGIRSSVLVMCRLLSLFVSRVYGPDTSPTIPSDAPDKPGIIVVVCEDLDSGDLAKSGHPTFAQVIFCRVQGIAFVIALIASASGLGLRFFFRRLADRCSHLCPMIASL
jgi:hypothetical protein